MIVHLIINILHLINTIVTETRSSGRECLSDAPLRSRWFQISFGIIDNKANFYLVGFAITTVEGIGSVATRVHPVQVFIIHTIMIETCPMCP
jgi:hypothetical protein